nr:uncharacterized protein LOC118877176 isoform X1 [Drosophila suzukii]
MKRCTRRLNGIPEAVSEHNNYPTPAEADLKGIALVTTHITFRNFSGLGYYAEILCNDPRPEFKTWPNCYTFPLGNNG